MKKIVINTCYGGFSLSAAGMKEYAKRKGLPLYASVNDRNQDGAVDFDHRVPVDPGSDEADSMFVLYHTAPLVDGKIPEDAYLSHHSLPRDDADLVAVVEALGEKADGPFASLKIVEIPDDVAWEIDEYDGNEHVEEKHRTWY